MDRNEIDELVPREFISTTDIERTLCGGSEQFEGSLDMLLVDFAKCCKKSEQKSWNVETLDLVEGPLVDGMFLARIELLGDFREDSLGDGGFVALIELLEDGYFNSIRELRIRIKDEVSQSSMERFSNLIQTGPLKDLRVLHMHFLLPHEATYENFWKKFAKSLSGARLSELTVTGLRHSGDLKEGAKAAEILADLVASGYLGSLQVLNLYGQDTGYEGMISLAQTFHSGHASEMQGLKLLTDRIGKAGATFLAKALGSSRLLSLRKLDLSFNSVGDEEAVVSLAKSMQSGHVSKLETLRLAGNGMGDEGTKSLAAALEGSGCPKLLSIDLEGNSVAIEGLVVLAKAFKSGQLTKVETIILPNPSEWLIEWEKSLNGIMEIVTVLEAGSLPSLKVMKLFDNWDRFRLSPNAIKLALENAYRRNPYLVARVCIEEFSAENDLMGDDATRITQMENLRRSNEERVNRLKVLQKEDVSGQHGKVFFCGDPRVGKTTLRVTLTGDKATMITTLMNKICCLFCRIPPEEQKSTRGIEVTNVQSKGVTLALWDLAGQHDYEILHSAFLPDLNFANGQATFFVIVCKSNNFDLAKMQLEYWMRFISSNSTKDISRDRRRRVFVVVNCFDGHTVPNDEVDRWKHLLAQCDEGFGMFLDVCKDPSIMNVKSRTEVEGFKSRILNEAREMLQRRKMPKICLSVQGEGRKWAQSNAQYPVLTWDKFRTKVGKSILEEQQLQAAAEYLHEAGHIILFRRLASSHETEREDLTSQDLVVVDPEWFCKQVVGHLLLPDDIARESGDKLEILKEDEGDSIPISTLTKGKFKVPARKVDQVVVILSRLGICYQLDGRTDMFVPALIDRVEVPGWSEGPWKRDSETSVWVMGFSLKVKNLRATLLPVIVLRKLQVSIALDKSICGQQECNYLARKFSIAFKYKDMHVLIEYSGQKQDRIDVLVKPLVRPSDLSRKQQINVAQEFVKRIVETVNHWARGVELDKQVIQPWSVAEGWMPIDKRNIEMSVEYLKNRVEENGKLGKMLWVVGDAQVEEQDVLSDEDLYKFLDTISRKVELTEATLKCLSDSDNGRRQGAHTSYSDISFPELKGQDAPFLRPLTSFLKKWFVGLSEGQKEILAGQKETLARLTSMHASVKKLREDVKGSIPIILEKQNRLNLQIQNLERFPIEEKERSIPRYAYVTKKGEQDWWMKLTSGVAETLVLRFLCEASCKSETRAFHEVKDQEGIDVKKVHDWAKTLLPMLAWTLKVTFVAGKIAGNIVLPGLGLLLGGDQELTRIFNLITQLTPETGELSKYLFEGLDAFLIKQSLFRNSEETVNGGSSSSWVPGTERQLRGDAKKAMLEVLNSLQDREKTRQLGLKRVWLKDSNSDGETHIVWICNECYMCYGPGIAQEV